MKKLAIFAAAFVLTLGLAQCKKEQPNAQISEGETVHITLNVNNNGSRADVNTSTGHITFNDNDKLYVGYNNAYVGTLDYSTSANKFSGDITISKSGSQRLHFYYLGGSLEPAIDGTEYTVDISDQSENYPVISYGTSNVDYTGGGTYSTTLLNKCALVEFTTNEIPTTTAVSISGMKNKLTVDFNGNTLTPSSEGTGSITLHTESTTSRWAILLPDGEVTTTATAEGYEESESFTIPAINNNDYWTQTNDKNISFTLTEAAATTITLTPSQIGDIFEGESKTINGITITTRYEEDGGSAFLEYNGVGEMYFGCAEFTFSSSERKISKIEVNYTGGAESGGDPYVTESWEVENSAGKFTLSGDPTYSVKWYYYYGEIYEVRSIVFTLSND